MDKMSIHSTDYDTYIPGSSSIVGKSVREVEDRFGLKIYCCYDSFLVEETSNKNVILKPGMHIKIYNANPEKLAKFRKCFKLP